MNSLFTGYVLLPIRRDLSQDQYLYSPVVSESVPHSRRLSPIVLMNKHHYEDELVHQWLNINHLSPSVPLMYIKAGTLGWMSEYGNVWKEDPNASSQLLSLLCYLYVFGYK